MIQSITDGQNQVPPYFFSCSRGRFTDYHNFCFMPTLNIITNNTLNLNQ